MNSKGPVIVIEDDIDDKEILEEVFQKLGYTNELLFFTDGQAALDFLNSTTYILMESLLADRRVPENRMEF